MNLLLKRSTVDHMSSIARKKKKKKRQKNRNNHYNHHNHQNDEFLKACNKLDEKRFDLLFPMFKDSKYSNKKYGNAITAVAGRGDRFDRFNRLDDFDEKVERVDILSSNDVTSVFFRIMEKLLSIGCDINFWHAGTILYNFCGEYNETHNAYEEYCARIRRQLEVIKFLLQNGANPNLKGSYNTRCRVVFGGPEDNRYEDINFELASPFLQACRKSDNLEIIRTILEHSLFKVDVDVLVKCNLEEDKVTALMLALHDNKEKLFDLLLKYGANINKKSERGFSIWNEYWDHTPSIAIKLIDLAVESGNFELLFVQNTFVNKSFVDSIYSRAFANDDWQVVEKLRSVIYDSMKTITIPFDCLDIWNLCIDYYLPNHHYWA